MEGIIQIFRRKRSLLTFLGLELFCLFLMSQFHDYYESRFFAVVNDLRNSTINVSGNIRQYLNLQEANLELQYRLTFLEEERIHLRSQLSSYQHFPQDTVLKKKFYLHSSEIIDMTLNRANNLFTSTLGRSDQIAPDMCVLSHNGELVGIVANVSERNNIIQPLINTQLKISAYHKGSSQVGVLSWNGNTSQELQLDNFPLHTRVYLKDTIYTRGFTHAIPADIPIGVITSIQPVKGTFLEIMVKPFVDFSTLRYVYIVRFRDKKEILSMVNNE